MDGSLIGYQIKPILTATIIVFLILYIPESAVNCRYESYISIYRQFKYEVW